MKRAKSIKVHAILVMVFLFCSRFLFGCDSGSAPVSTPESWVTALLDAPSCSAPCWSSISPGVTAITDTVQILSLDSTIVSLVGPTRGLGNRLNVGWQYENSQSNGLAVASQSGVVSAIHITVDAAQVITLQGILDEYGMPSHLLIREPSETAEYYYVDIIYLDKGLLVGLYLRRRDNIGVEVSAKNHITNLVFFVPGQQGLDDIRPGSHQSVAGCLQMWDGYNVYTYRAC